MLVLLDRDGVINEDLPGSVTHPDTMRLLPGAGEAIALLNRAGWKIAVVTNQSCVGRGKVSEAMLARIHEYMQHLLAEKGARLDKIYVCTDAPEQATYRRKPAPGMLLEAMREFNAPPERTPVVGDALRDLRAASAAGCPRYLVLTGKGQEALAQGLPHSLQPVQVEKNLLAAVRHMLHRYA